MMQTSDFLLLCILLLLIILSLLPILYFVGQFKRQIRADKERAALFEIMRPILQGLGQGIISTMASPATVTNALPFSHESFFNMLSSRIPVPPTRANEPVNGYPASFRPDINIPVSPSQTHDLNPQLHVPTSDDIRSTIREIPLPVSEPARVNEEEHSHVE